MAGYWITLQNYVETLVCKISNLLTIICTIINQIKKNRFKAQTKDKLFCLKNN